MQAGMYHYIRATGSPDGWNIAFYVFTFLRGILFFTVRGHLACLQLGKSSWLTASACAQVIVLVGTGWSYMKPLLAQREKRILMVVIPLQVSPPAACCSARAHAWQNLLNSCPACRYAQRWPS